MHGPIELVYRAATLPAVNPLQTIAVTYYPGHDGCQGAQPVGRTIRTPLSAVVAMIPRTIADLRLVYYPAPVLKKRAVPIESIGADVAALTARMFEIMREGKGLGLAAPQVGVGVRLFVCNVTGEPQDDVIFVNPRLHDLSGSEEKEEGCLSIPGVNVMMRRPASAGIDALDAKGCPFSLTGMELLARVWQHEMDHLDGRLIIDNMSATDEIANRRAIKQLRQDYTSAR